MSGSSGSLTVRSVKLSTLLSEHALERLDLLKIDIEGAEWIALTADDVLRRVRWVLGEVHPAMAGRSGDEMLEEFRSRGGFVRGWFRPGGIFVLARSAQPPT